MFGSDCGCLDGRGAAAQPQRAAAPGSPLAGKCVARETLTVLKKLAPADVFRKIVWENGTRLLKIA